MRRGTRAYWLAAGLALSGTASATADAAGHVVAPIIIVVNGWLQSFANGTGSASGCNTAQTCIAAKGKGEANLSVTALQPDGGQGVGIGPGFPPGEYKFTMSLTIDSGNTVPNGFGGTCSAAGGTLTLRPRHSSAPSLVLDLQGTECAVGNSATQQVLSATYVVEHPVPIVSAGASGTGSLSMSLDSAATPIAVDLSLSGHLNLWECPVCATANGQ